MPAPIEYPNINEKVPGDSGYVCHFAGSGKGGIGVYASSSYAAQLKAIEHFKPAKSKRHMVTVLLAEDGDGNVVPVNPAIF